MEKEFITYSIHVNRVKRSTQEYKNKPFTVKEKGLQQTAI